MAGIDDFLELQGKYGGQYIAERGKEVIAHAPTHYEVRELVRKMGLGERGGITYRLIQPRRAS